MLKDIQNKQIGIIGYESLTSKIIIKKILKLIHHKIICITLNKQSQQKYNIFNDSYFSLEQKNIIKQKILIIYVEDIQKYIKSNDIKIDILLNLVEPVDFSNLQQVIDRHLVATSKIVNALQKVQINKIIHISSIYVQQPGFVHEENQVIDDSITSLFLKKQQANSFLKQSFTSQIQAWRWSISFMQKQYSHLCKNTTIIRVPCLGPTYNKFQGYVSKFNYFTYLTYHIGLGNFNAIEGHRQNKIDIIPNDYLSNFILVLCYKQVENGIINLSTSTRNFITLQQLLQYGKQAWQEFGTKLPKVKILQNDLSVNLYNKKQQLPQQIKKRLGSMLSIINWKIEGQRNTLQIQQKMKLIGKYKYFLSQQWSCQSLKTIDIQAKMSQQQQQLFNFNVNNINWKIYIKLCVYSIKKHLLNQNVQQFKPQSLDLLGRNKNNQTYFSDIMWALKEGKQTVGQRRKQAVNFVLNSKAVKDAIKAIVDEKMMKIQNTPVPYQKAQQQLKKVAQQLCVQMFSDYSMNSIRVFGWFLHKLFGTIYQKVVVDKASISRIQSHKDENGPIIIIPTHRSYIDFLIISYVFFGYGIKCPHIAAAQDFLNMAVVHILLRKSGAFFIKRNQKKYKQLYKAIMNQYLTKLLVDNHFIQFFIQGTRSRTGKMLPPKFGILSIIANNVLQGRIKDAKILPVTINYQRILQGNSFTYEMMGQSKVKQSLSRVLKSADIIKENFGRIHLQFCDMISVKDFMENNTGSYQQKISKLGNKIVFDLSDKLIIAGPAIVSSALLMNRRGISDDSLQQKTSWLSRQISSRGVKITRTQADSSLSVSTTLGLLQGIVTKSKKDMFQVQVSFDQSSFVKLFTLTYYRNTLTHIFYQQALVITALTSFGHPSITSKSVKIHDLYNQSVFLQKLTQSQFYLQVPLSNKARFQQIIKILTSKNIIKIIDGNVVAIDLNSNYYNFYWSLVWPVVQSYWITCLYLFKVLKSNTVILLPKLLSQIQWFGQSLVNDRISTHLESISSDTIKNAVSIFQKMKIIATSKQQLDGEIKTYIKIAVQQQKLRDLLQKIQIFLKSSYAKSLKGIIGSQQGSVNIDFPFLSKL